MEPGDYLATIRSEGTSLLATASGHLDRPVPTCPEWDVAALVTHLGGVYGWVVGILESNGEPFQGKRPDPPGERAELPEWFASLHSQVIEALSTRPPDAPAWVFASSAPHEAGWWYRRQALETAVHRVDTESAVGQVTSVEPLLAADGIDEFLMQFLPGILRRSGGGGLEGTLHVHCTDTPGEWWLDFDAEGLTPKREHAKGDTALRGPASGLFLWLMNRQDASDAGMEVLGDGALVEAWPDSVRF
jgi:uncharacterized protein (TIGR03083 family)